MTIKDNILRVNYEIGEAAVKSGRKPEDITLIAVSKTVGHCEVKEAIKAGVSHFAENRVQMLLDKQSDPDLEFPKVDWHLIGHLQTNKVKYLNNRVSLIHSVDSIKLAEEISKKNNVRVLSLNCQQIRKEDINKILSKQTGKTLKTIEKDTDRDNFMSAKEALEYGLIDKVIDKR